MQEQYYFLGHDLVKLMLQGGNNIHAAGVSVIARVLKDNSVISTVSLNNYFVSCLCFCSFFAFSDTGFISHSQLELSYNPIGPDGAKALAEVIKFHGSVKTLKLGWCQVTFSPCVKPVNFLL